VRSFEVFTPATPEATWPLLARPARWHEWAPHLGGAWGLGEPEVEAGRLGAARLFGAVPVPARITGKTDGRDWTWQVGPVRMCHRVTSRPDGAAIGIDVAAPGPLEAVVAAAYGPVICWALRRLAARAADGQPSV